MIHGIKLKIKEQRERLKIEEAKEKKDKDPRKIQSLTRSIRSKKAQIRKIKLKNLKGRFKK